MPGLFLVPLCMLARTGRGKGHLALQQSLFHHKMTLPSLAASGDLAQAGEKQRHLTLLHFSTLPWHDCQWDEGERGCGGLGWNLQEGLFSRKDQAMSKGLLPPSWHPVALFLLVWVACLSPLLANSLSCLVSFGSREAERGGGWRKQCCNLWESWFRSQWFLF